MNKKNMIVIIVVVIVVGVIGFWLGLKYGQSASVLAKLSTAKKQTLFQALRDTAGGIMGTNGARLRGAFQSGQGGFATGQIINKDEKSITIQSVGPNSTGSKIIFYSASTNIGKTASGTPEDLQKGVEVLVSGTSNPDGSINAQSINLNPALRLGGMGGQNRPQGQ